MKTSTSENEEAQQERLNSRAQDQQMLNEVVKGTGISAWEASSVIDIIHEACFKELLVEEWGPPQNTKESDPKHKTPETA